MSNLMYILRAVCGSVFLALLLCACTAPQRCAREPIVALTGASAQEAKVEAMRTLACLFPPQYRSVQRAVITIRHKQFTCDGALEVSPTDGWNLAVASNLGLVTGLQVNRDGSCVVLKKTPLFSEEWARRFVARDVRRLFVPPTEFISAGRLGDGRLVCETAVEPDGAVARYILSPDGRQWQELEVLCRGRCEYQAFLRGYRSFAGITPETPAEIEVRAKNYQLHLRLVQLDVKRTIASEAAP